MTRRHPVHGRNDNSVLFNLSDIERQQDAASAQPEEMSGLLALRIPSRRRNAQNTAPRPSPPLVAIAGGGRRSRTGWLPWVAFGASALALVACATWYFTASTSTAGSSTLTPDKPAASTTSTPGVKAGMALSEVRAPRRAAVPPKAVDTPLVTLELDPAESTLVVAPPVEPEPIEPSTPTGSETVQTVPKDAPVKRPTKRPAKRPIKRPAKETRPPATNDRAKELLKQLQPKTEPGTSKPPVAPATSLPTRLSSPKVRAKLKSARTRMKACLKLADTSAFGGTVNVRVELLGRGAVKSARARAAGLVPAVQSCMVRALKAVKFGSFQDSSQVVNYPLRLK